MTRRARGDWQEVGEAARAVAYRAANLKRSSPSGRPLPELKPLEWRVLTAVLAFTAMWTRFEDDVSREQLAKFAGLWPEGDAKGDAAAQERARKRVGITLGRLHDLGLIVYRPGQGHTVGRVSLPRDPQRASTLRPSEGSDSEAVGSQGRDSEGLKVGTPPVVFPKYPKANGHGGVVEMRPPRSPRELAEDFARTRAEAQADGEFFDDEESIAEDLNTRYPADDVTIAAGVAAFRERRRWIETKAARSSSGDAWAGRRDLV